MSETRLKIRLLNDPALRKKAEKIKEVTSRHREILSQMAQIMYAASGVGLAAPQIGICECLIVIDAGTGGLYKLMNPQIVKKEGVWVMEEGCLSVPGVYLKIKRAKKVIVEAIDENAKPVKIEAEDLLACVFQHEIDHLNGKLIVDYANITEGAGIKEQKKPLKI
jgi:peptide deformylase